jgi:hypothetical protein
MAYLLGESICQHNMVCVSRFLPYEAGNVRRPRCSRLIFQAAKVGFNLVEIHFELHLIWKGDITTRVLRDAGVCSTINHDA